jgi:hypothetical protein
MQALLEPGVGHTRTSFVARLHTCYWSTAAPAGLPRQLHCREHRSRTQNTSSDNRLSNRPSSCY